MRRIFVTWLASPRPEAVLLCPGNRVFPICTQVGYASVNNRRGDGVTYRPVFSLPALSVSGLDELTREELLGLVIKLHETVQAQQKEIAEMKTVVERQAQRISAGEIVEILHAVAKIGAGEYDELLKRIRGSPVAHGGR